LAQRSEWTRDPLVSVVYRTLNYQNGQPQEKGIDVLVALRVVRAAEVGDFDAVMLASHDTDLEPALADAAERKNCHVETVGWQGCKVLRAGVQLWHTTLGPTEFVRSRDRKDYT